MCPSLPRIIIVDPSCPRVFFKCPSLNITTNLSQLTQYIALSQSSSTNLQQLWSPWTAIAELSSSYLLDTSLLVLPISSVYSLIHIHHIHFLINVGLCKVLFLSLSIYFPSEFHPHPGFSSPPRLHPQFSANRRLLEIMVP